MKLEVARCGICEQSIWMDVPETAGPDDVVHLREQFDALADEHLRSHPEAVQALFWLRRFLDDVRPSERAVAVKRIYSDLRALWGDQDSRGVYAIDEVLGSASLYRMWLAANRCSYPACVHAENVADAADNTSALTWRNSLLGSLLPPTDWKGTLREWRQLAQAASHNCTCPSTQMHSALCPAHRLLEHPKALNRLLFGRRMAQRLQHEEFACADLLPAAA